MKKLAFGSIVKRLSFSSICTKGNRGKVSLIIKRPKCLAVGLVVIAAMALGGCQGACVSSEAEMTAFNKAGPVHLQMDFNQLLGMRISRGPYSLVPGDVLEFQMPTIIRLLPDREGDETDPYRCRIDSAGKVVLPIVGEVKVAGQTLSETEAAITGLYFPKYVLQEPSIVVSVNEYRVGSVSLVGGVQVPGVYELRSNEMTLISALMKAGGIAEDGATAIHIYRVSQDQTKPVTIPVLGMNIPSRDEKLTDGDTVVVEALLPQVITVIGLVKKPGLFPWSPKNKYNVMDALAFAGGVNDLADPQYVKVYRQDDKGKIVSAVLKLNGSSAVGAGELYLKPGDVIAVEQTHRTRTRLFLAQIVKMGVGVNAGASVGGP